MNKKTGELRGAACVAAAGILWGILGIFVRGLGAFQLTSMDIVGIRAAVASSVLLVFLAVFDRKALKIRLRDLWCFLGTGIGSIVFFNYCYFTAVQMMSLAAAVVLLYTAPAFVMILSRVLFGEALSGKKIAALLFTLAGCALVTGVAGSAAAITPAGLLIGLGAGLGYGLYTIFGHYALVRGYSAATITFYTFLVAAVSVCLGNGAGRMAAAAASPEAVGLMLALGIVSTIVPFFFYTIGLTFLDGSRASIIACIEPVTAAAVGVLFFGEAMSLWTLSGMGLVLLGIFITSR